MSLSWRKVPRDYGLGEVYRRWIEGARSNSVADPVNLTPSPTNEDLGAQDTETDMSRQVSLDSL
jgi:hypothetical protein